MSKDAYYFSHDSNSRFDPKILKLRSKYGLEGYGFYFCLLEIMRDEKDYVINKNEIDVLSMQLLIESSKAKAILDFCLSIALLKEDNNKIFSESFLIRMELMNNLREKRQEAGRKGGKAKAKLKQNDSKSVALKETKLKEKEIKESFDFEKLRKENTDYERLTDWQIEDVERMKAKGEWT